MFDCWFGHRSPIQTWYFGVITNARTLRATDTLGSHAGWEEMTAYDGDGRKLIDPAWATRNNNDAGTTNLTPGAHLPIAWISQNNTPVLFEFRDYGVVNGVFITDNATKAGTVGLLIYMDTSITTMNTSGPVVVFPGFAWQIHTQPAMRAWERYQIPE